MMRWRQYKTIKKIFPIWAVLGLLLMGAVMLSGCQADDGLGETESSETEFVETEPSESESPKTEFAETEPSKTKPEETESAETEPPRTEPTETKPPETESAETKPPKTEPAETKPPKTEPTETKPAETEPAETRPPETVPAETEPPETDPVVTKPAGSGAAAIELIFDQIELCAADGTGTAVTYDGWASTGYVDIRGYYALSYVLAARDNVYAVSFFDADGRLISGVAGGEGRDTFTIATTQGSVVIPEGAVYARFITYNGARDPMKDASVTAYPTRADYEAGMASRPFSGLKIACLGDSLTEGDYGLQVGVANVFYRNYPFFLARITGASTVNYGYCGATSSYYLGEYNAGNVEVSDADAVILMMGTNLGLDGDLGSAYEQLVSEVREDMKEGAVLVLVTPPHATEDESKPNYGYHENVVSAVGFVRAFAATEGLPLIDAYADSPIQPENEGVYQANDGLHMCEAGYEAFAAFIAEELAGILK